MRVVHYYPWALQGESGPAIAVRGWCTAQAALGAEVRLIAGDTEDDHPLPGVEVVRLERGHRDVPMPGSLRPLLDGADVAVVHGGWEVRNLIAARDAASAGVPVVATPHGVYYPQVFRRGKVRTKRAWWATVERPFLERVSAIHVFYPREAQDLRRLGIRTPVIVAPNAYRPPDGVVREPAPDRYLLWLGRYDPYHKGIDLLLHAMHRIPAAERPRLRLAGTDWKHKHAQVAELSSSLQLDKTVTVGPPVFGTAKWALLAGATAFVHPSRWDAAPISVLEAASIGTPTVVTPFPLGAFLAERGGAFLVQEDPASIAEGILRACSEEAEAVGRRGAEVIGTELTWSEVGASWFGQLRSALAEAA